MNVDAGESSASTGQQRREPAQEPKEQSRKHSRGEERAEAAPQPPQRSSSNNKAVAPSCPGQTGDGRTALNDKYGY
ncbi:hypothetical protein GBF38_021917 [Nibea albiflora]|uniref:Uncharacterized protein n=1 Tax=Nibea albiflora TaxID=240163 RepID=A0ACB7FH81_NIBAL|nr:hypothetical protein GBF38_021917 [Nibea albiflora]